MTKRLNQPEHTNHAPEVSRLLAAPRFTVFTSAAAISMRAFPDRLLVRSSARRRDTEIGLATCHRWLWFQGGMFARTHGFDAEGPRKRRGPQPVGSGFRIYWSKQRLIGSHTEASKTYIFYYVENYSFVGHN